MTEEEQEQMRETLRETRDWMWELARMFHFQGGRMHQRTQDLWDRATEQMQEEEDE